MNTGGYGGRTIRENVRVNTNDFQCPWFELTLTGPVEKFAEIRPRRIRLTGAPNQTLSAEVEIIPRKEYPFKIVEVKPRNGRFITFELTKRCAVGQNRCVLRVENKRQEKGRYSDVLYVKTDSPLQPTIPIYITGFIH